MGFVKENVHKIRVLSYIIRNIKNWPTFLKAHFRQDKNKMLVKFRNGLKVFVRPHESDVTMLMETWGMRYYTPKNFKINKNDVVFDIGTHIGSFSLFAAKHASEGKVFSFEPLPINFEMFKKNISLNKIKNITPINAAVSFKSGSQKLFLYEGTHTGSSSLYVRNSDKFVKIKTVTLANMFKKYNIKRVNFMKIDCEGAEYDILFNLPKDIFNKIDKISMEYHDHINEHRHPELMKFFKDNNWKAILDGEFIYAKNMNKKK